MGTKTCSKPTIPDPPKNTGHSKGPSWKIGKVRE